MNKKNKSYPSRAADVPVTQKMLYAVRDELSSRIEGIRDELGADLAFRIGKVDASIHQLAAQIHGMKVLVEEQNAKNNIVLDGLGSLFERQARLEVSWTKLRNSY